MYPNLKFLVIAAQLFGWLGYIQDLDRRSKMEKVVPNIARCPQACMRYSFALSFICKRKKGGCDRGSEGVKGHSGQKWRGEAAPLARPRKSGRAENCLSGFAFRRYKGRFPNI